jgi:hypothetical protein
MRVAPGVLRLKVFLASGGPRVVAALLLVAVAAFGGAAVAAADPPTTAVAEDRHRQTVATDLNTSAVVTGNTTLYERGRRLEEMPVYLLSATPELTVRLRTTVPESADARVSQQLRLTYRAERGGNVFWRQRRSVAADTVEPTNGTAVTEAQLRMPRVLDRLDRYRSELDGAGTLSVVLQVRVDYDTGRYRGNLTASAPVQLSGGAYWLGGDVAAERTHATTVRERRADRSETVTVPRLGAAVSHAALILFAIGCVSLLGAGSVVRFYRSDPDEAALRRRLHRARYGEWISEGSVPTDVGEHVVDVRSLEALVDVAIDSSKRVIRDPERDLYAVLDGEVVYYYRPGSELGPFVRASVDGEGEPDGPELF